MYTFHKDRNSDDDDDSNLTEMALFVEYALLSFI